MSMSNPHHKFIYGAPANRIQKVLGEVIINEPFQKFAGPARDAKEIGNYIGFEYSRIYGLFDSLKYTYGDTFTICNESVPEDIKKLFAKTYPGVAGKVYALIQDVYVAKFVTGVIATGYWIQSTDKYDELLELSYEYTYHENLSILSVGHNMRKRTPSEFFIGIIIKQIDSCEDCDPSDFNRLARRFHATYTVPELPPKDEILIKLHEIDPAITLSYKPMTCLIESMCYCCT
jgi:hypothetical protein